MLRRLLARQRLGWLLILAACSAVVGCATVALDRPSAEPRSMLPTELQRCTLPEHIIAPPDILLIDAVALVPRPPYKIKPLDGLFVQVTLAEPRKDEKEPPRT